MFANALRTHARLQVLTATRVALPATRSISSLVAFRTAVPKNVSLVVLRSFTTSQVARNDFERDSRASSTIFVANIPWSATEEDISEVFGEFGKVLNVRLHMGADGRPRGICHIDFASKESAVAALESAAQEPIHLAGRDLRVDYSDGVKSPAAPQAGDKLYFSGCAGDESEVREIFKDFNDSIVDIHLLKDPQTGERLPTGFVQLNSIATATEALDALNGTQTPYGESLAVSYARPRRFQPPGFSDQGRRGGSGNYGGNYNRGGNSGGNRPHVRSSNRSRWD
jgi:nucleolin